MLSTLRSPAARRPLARVLATKATPVARHSTALAPEPAGAPTDDPWFHEPTVMSNSEAFVETLRGHGCDTMFGIVGSAFMDALDLFMHYRSLPSEMQNRIRTFYLYFYSRRSVFDEEKILGQLRPLTGGP